jgi:transcriptional regulator with XRE-family HTH domain
MNSAEQIFYKKLGKVIQRKRNDANLNQDALAFKVGIKRTSLTNIESGKQTVQAYLLYQIAISLNVSIDDLLREAMDKPSDLASLLNGQKVVTNSGETSSLNQNEKDIVLKMVKEQNSTHRRGKISHDKTK